MEAQQEVGIDELLQALPLVERVPAVALKTHFDQRTALDEEQEMQLEVVRRKYNEKVKPLLDRAAELIQGSTPKTEEVAALSQYLKAGEKPGQLKGKVIDNYWNSALQNSALQAFITERDEHALEYLLNIQSTDDSQDLSTVNFRFLFKENPYFTETTVVRRLKMAEGRAICLEGDLLTPKAGNWLTHESRKVTNKATGETKMVQGKKVDSFFDIFLNWTLVDNSKELTKCTNIFQELSIVVRESFNFFLGLYEPEDSEDEEEDYDEELDSEEASNKKAKK